MVIKFGNILSTFLWLVPILPGSFVQVYTAYDSILSPQFLPHFTEYH